MNSYVVEIVETTTYAVDILADDMEKAEAMAWKNWEDIVDGGVAHYHEVGDPEYTIGTICDVTGTDDDVFEQEECQNKNPSHKTHEHIWKAQIHGGSESIEACEECLATRDSDGGIIN